MDKSKCPVCGNGLRKYELETYNNKFIYICFHCVRVFTFSYTEFAEVTGESMLKN